MEKTFQQETIVADVFRYKKSSLYFTEQSEQVDKRWLELCRTKIIKDDEITLEDNFLLHLSFSFKCDISISVFHIKVHVVISQIVVLQFQLAEGIMVPYVTCQNVDGGLGSAITFGICFEPIFRS